MSASALLATSGTTVAPVNINVLVVITVIYVLIIGYLGFRGYKESKTTTDYLLAGRNIHPYVMALSYGATFISTSAIVGFGGFAALFGMGLLWLTFLNIFAGILIAFVFFGKRTRRMGHNMDAHTFPELLGRRFQSKFIQVFAAVVIFLIMPLYAAAVLRGGAEFIQVTFGISLNIAVFIFALIIAAYVVAGGLKGVMFTDALQGSIMFIGMVLLLVMTYWNLGGVVDAHQALTEMNSVVPESLAKSGHQGWTSMPVFPSPFWYVLVTSIVLGVGIGVLAQPQLAVRFMTVKSGRELNRAVLVGGIFILMMTGVAFVVGALSNVYFFQLDGMPAVNPNRRIDEVIPVYINSALPGWFVVIFMLTLLSAAMSTISSQFHAMGTSIGRDIYEEGMGMGRKGGSSIMVTRLGIIVAFIVTLILSLVMPPNVGIIARATAIFFGTCAVAFLPMFVGGLYTRRITREGATSGMIVGFLLALFWSLFVHKTNASAVGLCKLLTDKDFIGSYPWIVIDALVIALPVSIIVTIVVSLMTKPLPSDHLDKCLKGVGRCSVSDETTSAPAPSTGAKSE